MNTPLVFLLSAILATGAQAACHTIHVVIGWTFDSKSGSWTTKDTGLTFSIAAFHQDHADPVQKDGSASFSYSGAHGIITLFMEHRLAAGFPGSGDCTPAMRDNYLQVMRKSYGKTDSEEPFRLSYNSAGKRGRGVGRMCHFLSFPDFRGALLIPRSESS